MNKDTLIILFALITVASVAAAFMAFEKQGKLAKSLEEERYGRMVADESSQKSAAKLATLEAQLQNTKEKMAKLKDVLDQEKGVNDDMKAQYEKLSQAKAELEARLSAAVQEAPAAPAAETTPAAVPAAAGGQ